MRLAESNATSKQNLGGVQQAVDMMSNVVASAEKSGIDDGEVLSSGFATGHLGTHGFGIQNMKVSERHAGRFKGPSEFVAYNPVQNGMSDAEAAGLEFKQ